MTPSFRLIRELFDLPGQVEPNPQNSVPRVAGRNEKESSNLGHIAMNDEDYEAAIEHFKSAVEQSDEKSPWALMDLASAYAATDQIPQAFRQYEKAMVIQKSGELQIGLASLLRQTSRGRDAILALKEACNAEPTSAYYHYKLAEELKKQGYRTEAIGAAQVAISLAPDQAFYHCFLGELFLDKRLFQEAVESLHAAIELSPGDHEYYFLVSQALWGAGKHQEAIRAVRLATDIATENLAYRGVLERMLRATGLTEEADQEVSKLEGSDLYDDEIVKRTAEKLKI